MTDATAAPRVLWWLSEFPPDPGGIATIAGLLHPALEERGTDLTMLAVQGDPSEQVVGATTLIRRPIWADFRSGDDRRPITWLPFVRELKSRIRPDIYHVHLCEPSPILHVLTRATATAPTVLTLHNDKLPVLGQTDPDSLFGRLLDMSTVVIAVSSAAADSLVHRRPDVAGRVVVIPNGIVVGSAPTPVPSGPELLAAGRIVPQKGFDTLIRAMPAVVTEIPDVRLTVAGEGVDREMLMTMATSLGVGAHVRFLGHVTREEIHDLMAATRVVVMPSRHEGMPLVALEAAERGRCVVGTDVGGINEVVVDEATGLLVDGEAVEDDPALLARAIVRSLAEPGLAERLGSAARERAAERFSIDVCADAHRVVYRQVGARTPAPRVSVVMPAWNAAAYIEQAMRSALDQTFADLELIVVDDGSDDDTVARALAVDDPRVVVLRQPHRCCSAARNAGLALARGQLIAQLDADDLWPAGRLAALVAVMDEDPSLEACFGLAREFAEPDAPPNAVVATEPQPVRMPTTGIVRASAHARIGPYRGTHGDQMDWAMRALADTLAYRQVDEVVLLRRIHGRNMSHARPFTEDRGRVALLKSALDLRARRASEAASARE